jgi:two-component system LytT family response regulator
MDELRAIVVDDEQLAREEMCFQLGRVGGVEVVAQAGNGVDAVRVIEESEPDVVLLDVQMPGLSGFEVARRLLDGKLDAHIVFVTAFDQCERRGLSAQAGRAAAARAGD